MDGCGHERTVHRRCQIWGEYRATSLCQLFGLPSRTLCVEKGLAVCMEIWWCTVFGTCGMIIVSICQICGGHGGTKMGFS
jgi:hypothetical protein